MTSCQSTTVQEESAIEDTLEDISEDIVEENHDFETVSLEFKGRVISSVYEDFYMYWDDLCILLITYTAHFEGLPEFGLIGYQGEENPVLLVGNTKTDGYGEYDMYCFMDNRVYKSDETIKGMLYYNCETKQFASVDQNDIWNLYTYYENHIIWIREEDKKPDGFEKMKLYRNTDSPPPTVETIREYIIY